MNDRIIELFTDTTFFGISILNLLVALCVAVLTFVIARAVIGLLMRRVQRWSEHDGAMSQVLAKVLAGTSNSLLLLASLLVGLSMLDLPERWLGRVSSLCSWSLPCRSASGSIAPSRWASPATSAGTAPTAYTKAVRWPRFRPGARACCCGRWCCWPCCPIWRQCHRLRGQPGCGRHCRRPGRAEHPG